MRIGQKNKYQSYRLLRLFTDCNFLVIAPWQFGVDTKEQSAQNKRTIFFKIFPIKYVTEM